MGDTFTIYRCRVCKAHEWAAEEIMHARHACPGSIERLTLIPVDADVVGDPRVVSSGPVRAPGPRRWG